MLEKNKTVDKERYLSQLHRMNKVIQQKRANQWHLYENSCRNNTNIVKKAMDDLEWEVLPHPLYSPKLAQQIINFSTPCQIKWRRNLWKQWKSQKLGQQLFKTLPGDFLSKRDQLIGREVEPGCKQWRRIHNWQTCCFFYIIYLISENAGIYYTTQLL